MSPDRWEDIDPQRSFSWMEISAAGFTGGLITKALRLPPLSGRKSFSPTTDYGCLVDMFRFPMSFLGRFAAGIRRLSEYSVCLARVPGLQGRIREAKTMQLTGPHFPDPASAARSSQGGNASTEDSDTIRLAKTDPGTRLAYREFGHYQLLEIMGEGQFGTVWRAKDQQLERIVALKLPHLQDWNEQTRTMFLREARAAAALEHLHIVRVHGIEQDGDRLGIVSQFIVGQTLLHLLQERSLTFAQSTAMLAAIADAVHHAHESGVIHRDLKPSNILVDQMGQPHVSDFGLAKWSGDHATMTNPGMVMGTPAYMSPEQARGDSDAVDCRSDVYSLGVLLYEMLTGNPPFEGNSTLLLHQIQSQAPVALRSHNRAIPKDLESICHKCLAKSPNERYVTARELADDLRRYQAGVPISARPVSVAEHFVSWTRRNPTLATSLAVAAVSTVAAIGFGLSIFAVSRPESLGAGVGRDLTVSVVTDPPGATVVIYPIDELTGEPILDQGNRPSKKSPATVKLSPGDYLVVAALDDDRFHEVFRHVPRDASAMPDYYPHRAWETLSDGSISWHPITIPTRDHQGMTLLADTDCDQLLNPYFLDQQEITVSDFLREFHEQLPLSLRGRSDLLRTPDFPLTGLFFDEAVLYAEKVGKRLPTAQEYEFAATNGWTTRYPWGDTAPPADAWTLTRVGLKEFDRSQIDQPILGLFSNASEFVLAQNSLRVAMPTGGALITEAHPAKVAVRGGPIQADAHFENDPRSETSIARKSLRQQIGFRCAKNKSPRL